MADSTVERIEVFSSWVGFADPSSRAAKLIITKRGDHFLREQALVGSFGGLSAELIARLLALIAQRAVPELDPALFDLPESVIRSHYASLWTDDSPSHLVRISFSNGRVISIRAESQQAFMLPLEISDSESGTNWKTYDPRLSRGLAALMPDGYPDKERLGGNVSFLERELRDVEPLGEQPASLPEATEPDGGVSSDSATNPEAWQSSMDEILRILHREESAQEKEEAERAGQLSERLLKRIPLEDVRDLLTRGADPNVADSVGQTALMLAAFPPFDADKFHLLVQAGANLEARRDGWTGLHMACAGGEWAAAGEWVKAGANIHARTPEGSTPLMLAARWNNIVPLLLAAGAKLNEVDQDGHTPLVYAILQQSWVGAEDELAAMQALIDAGADVNLRDRQGITPLAHARRVLDRVLLEEEVLRAFNPDVDLTLGLDWNDRRMAEAVATLISSAGGHE
jgi:hypothetical protein